MAKKCSLPAREVDPKTGLLYEDGPPKEVNQEQMRRFALQAFFHDYSVSTPNASLSGGFLGGLERMVQRLGFDSPVADACKATAFASNGLKLSREYMINEAEVLHQNLLNHLALRMKTPAASGTGTLAIAILLGLYQVIMS